MEVTAGPIFRFCKAPLCRSSCWSYRFFLMLPLASNPLSFSFMGKLIVNLFEIRSVCLSVLLELTGLAPGLCTCICGNHFIFAPLSSYNHPVIFSASDSNEYQEPLRSTIAGCFVWAYVSLGTILPTTMHVSFRYCV